MNVQRSDTFRKKFKNTVFMTMIPRYNFLINRIWHDNSTGLYIPKIICIEPTNYCNAKCIMCPNEIITRDRGSMNWELFTGIIEQAKAFEGRGLTIFLSKDGEPLLDPMIFERIEYAKKHLRRSIVNTVTNASLLDEEKADRLLATPLDCLTISIDGASETTYSKIRPGLEYSKVKANAESFLRKKKQMGSKLKVWLCMLESPLNIHEQDEYLKQWGDKADVILFKPMTNFLVRKTSVHGEEIGSKQLRRCAAAFHTMNIYWNGNIALCCWDYDNLVSLGNVADRSLLELFNGEGFKVVREKMKKKECSDVYPCKMCSRIYGYDQDIGVTLW